LPFAACFGVVLAELGYVLLSPPALIPAWSLRNAVLSLVLVDVGFIEETLFRGVIQDTLVVPIGERNAIALISVLFGVMYASYGGLAGVPFGIGLGVLLGIIYEKVRSLSLTMTIHGVMNVFLFAVIPLHGSLLL
jgi:membrane protease YdiL (CAAX protease family)